MALTANGTIAREPAAGGHAVPANRRGRPPRGTTARIDRAVLDAGRGLMLQRGYSETTMEAVAAGAGISKPTLYSRYPDKAALFAAVVKDRLADWGLAAQDACLPADTLEGRLRGYASSIVRRLASEEIHAFTILILTESIRFPELARIYHETANILGRDRVVALMREATDASAYDLGQADDWAMTFIEIIWGWFSFQLLQSANPDTRTHEAAIQKRLDLLLLALPPARAEPAT